MTSSEIVQLIAKRTGSSPTTIRRVLRGGNKEVWPGTAAKAARIREAARETGFLANASASAVRKGRFGAAMLLLSTDPGRSHLPESLLHSLCAALDKVGMRLVISRCDDRELTDRRRLPGFLASRSCDGVIVNYTDGYPERMESLLATFRIPFVWLNAPLESRCIRYDDRAAGRAAAERLLALGHRRLAFVNLRTTSAENPHHSAAERREGFLEAIAAAGLSASVHEFGNLDGPAQRDAVIGLLRCDEAPTGIVAYDRADRILLAAVAAGLSVPRDLSIITFGEAGANACGVPLSLMAVPSRAAGVEAAALLLQAIESPSSPISRPPLPFFPVDGDTLAPPPPSTTHVKNRRRP